MRRKTARLFGTFGAARRTPRNSTNSFAPFADAFVLDGTGPRFGQDIDALEGAKIVPVSNLLIDAPGENTIDKNIDLFQKRGQIDVFGRAAAAMALFALQTFAPSGGAGHLTSLRGGGPLTTIVAPSDKDVGLWRVLWLNTPALDKNFAPADSAKEEIFPWLAPTITSEGKPPRMVSPDSSHILQAFWGLPRRIRLVVEANSDRLPCPLTSEIDEFVVTGFRRQTYGVRYDPSFFHVLSPYRLKDKHMDLWLPIHPQPGGILYKDWPSIAGAATLNERPAKIISVASNRLAAIDEDVGPIYARIMAWGFDMGKATARGFVEAEIPLFFAPDRFRDEFQRAVFGLVRAADLAANEMRLKIRTAVAGERANPDAERFAALRESFFAGTEQDFYFEFLPALIEKLHAHDGDPAPVTRALAEKWLSVLRREAISLFDESVDFDALPLKIMERAVPARRNLIASFAGYGGMGKNLLAALDLAPPQPAKKATKKSGKAT